MNWRFKLCAVVIAAQFGSVSSASARECLTNDQIASLIIQETTKVYRETRGRCGCPTDMTKDNHMCGLRSANSRRRAGGPMPKCRAEDVSNDDIKAYKAQHPELVECADASPTD